MAWRRTSPKITGYDQVSIQPNAGSQGELAGLLAIRGYHLSRGDHQRNVCLIPASAHGTNAASAVLAGMKVVVVATAADGTIDHADLYAKIEAHKDVLSAIMITYPSTHGVYDADVREVCDAIHAAGGQVYVDGANLNALVGLAQPGKFGGDVSHLNLHKTFCIPHGGGGPGVGPVAAKAHLAPFMPGDANKAAHEAGPAGSTGVAISASRFGSAGVLPISWAYVKLMGGSGLTEATKSALLAANYVASRLNEFFPVLYTGDSGLVAHECILDLRGLTARTGVTAEDVGQTPDRLRLPRPHPGVPGRGHADGGAHRVRGPGRDRPVHRRDDHHPRRDRAGRQRRLHRGELPAAQRTPHGGRRDQLRLGPRLPARAGRLPRALTQAGQVLPAGGPHRRRRRRPQPGLLLPSAFRVRKLRIPQ
jgi:hypothetical protein